MDLLALSMAPRLGVERSGSASDKPDAYGRPAGLVEGVRRETGRFLPRPSATGAHHGPQPTEKTWRQKLALAAVTGLTWSQAPPGIRTAVRSGQVGESCRCAIRSCGNLVCEVVEAALPGEEVREPVASVQVAGFGGWPEHGDGVIDATLLDEQVGQPVGGRAVSSVGALPEFVYAALLNEQVGQLFTSMRVAGVGALPEFLDMTLLGEQPGKAVGGQPVAGVGTFPKVFEATPLGEQVREPIVSRQVSGVCRSPQYGDHVVDAALLGKQVDQPVGSGPVAGIGALPQRRDRVVDAALLGEQPGQPVGGCPVAGVCALPEFLDAALLCEQMSQEVGGGERAGLDGLAVQAFGLGRSAAALGVVGHSHGVVGMMVVDEGLPGAAREGAGAAYKQGVLMEVVGHRVARDLPHASRNRSEGGGGTVQPGGGVGEALVEPVRRCGGLRGGGQVAGCGGGEIVAGQWCDSPDAERVPRGSDHSLAVALIGGGPR